MFNFGISELLVLAVIALFVIGPEKLPEFARNLMRTLNDLKRASQDVMKPIDDLRSEAQKIVTDTKDSVKKEVDRHLDVDQVKKVFDFEDDYHKRHDIKEGHQEQAKTSKDKKDPSDGDETGQS